MQRNCGRGEGSGLVVNGGGGTDEEGGGDAEVVGVTVDGAAVVKTTSL